MLLALWLPLVGVIHWLVTDQNTVSIIVMALLFVEFLCLLHWWSRHVYGTPSLLQQYGLVWTRQNAKDLVEGLGIGAISLLSLFLLQGILGWISWQPLSLGLIQIGLEGLMVALGVALGEELIFRGWLLDELQRDYRLTTALWASSLAFAVLHYIKPFEQMLQSAPQFFGLVLLGLTLVWAKRSTSNKQSLAAQGRLGLPIGLHAGLVWGYYIINVGELVDYSGRVPEWVTGIDRNPLAGGIGVLFLGVLALCMRRRCQQLKRQDRRHAAD
ncbi:CPBP family intramembrane metalloprotease [Oculatella sp. LEGE 06141]|nr:CPBP family intramembrane metalloprotease [Oculatella sp. LEGE 06141]